MQRINCCAEKMNTVTIVYWYTLSRVLTYSVQAYVSNGIWQFHRGSLCGTPNHRYINATVGVVPQCFSS